METQDTGDTGLTKAQITVRTKVKSHSLTLKADVSEHVSHKHVCVDGLL